MHVPSHVDLRAHSTRHVDHRPWRHRVAIENAPQNDVAEVAARTPYSRADLQTAPQLREIIPHTYGQIAFIDEQVGRIRTALAETGTSENTITIHTSDQGEWLGDHGLILKGPMPYEGLLRAPMLEKGPGVPRGKRVSEPASTLDIAATLFDYAETRAGLRHHGASLRPLLETDERRDSSMMEWELSPNHVGVALSLRTVRTRS